MKATDEQQAVYERAPRLRQGDVLKVIAMAGAGKTTTLVGTARCMPGKGAFLAFNRAIADEAAPKLAVTRCKAFTMHKLAYRVMAPIMKEPVKINANTFKASRVAERHSPPKVFGWGDYRIGAAVVRTIREFCQSADGNIGPAHAQAAIIEAVGDPEFLIGSRAKARAQEAIVNLTNPIVDMARDYWNRCVDADQYSFDMYLKAIDLDHNLLKDCFRGLNYLMVDEAQDINPVIISILRKTGLPMIAVGDPYQQIYSWRGATNALKTLEGDELHLTQSFRFGENIAEVARKILASRPDGGPSQHLSGLGPGDIKTHKGPPIFTICRTNMGVLEEGVRSIAKGYKTHVNGMDELISEVRSALALKEGRLSDITATEIRQFDNWEQMEEAAEIGEGSLLKLVNLVNNDRVGLVERLNTDHVKIPDQAQIMVQTGHASKGLESLAVRLGDDWKDIAQLRQRHEAAQKKSERHVIAADEEFNTLYVACTRAKVRLTQYEDLINPKPRKEVDFWAEPGEIQFN